VEVVAARGLGRWVLAVSEKLEPVIKLVHVFLPLFDGA
jgi:hypothetical protein